MSGAESPGALLPSLPEGARLLVIRLRSIGDIILLTPALQLVKQWRPDLRFTVMVEAQFRELLEGNPDVEEILPLERQRGWEQVAGRIRLAREVRRRDFSLCLNLHGGPTSAWLALASGAPRRATFAHHRLRAIYTHLIPDARGILNQAAIHTAEHQASAFFHLGLPRREVPRARLVVSPAHAAWWNEKREESGLAGQDYAVVHPTALYFTKQWAPEHFARLARYLEDERGLRVLLACGPGESAVLDGVKRAAGRNLARLENAGLGEYAAALAQARLFVGNDSGPAHMAAALARPVVVIFGSSSSAIWGPWPRKGGGRVVQNFYECNPCPGDRCYRFDRPECILSVTFEQVRDAVAGLLEGPVPGRD